MLLGDLALVPGDQEDAGAFDSIVICGGGKLFGWHPDDPSGIKPLLVSPNDLIGAWRL
jgi:hypothetical protein